MEELRGYRTLPKWITIPINVIIVVVVLCWVGIVLYRKWIDRNVTMQGYAPSWFNPFGVEWQARPLLKTLSIGVGACLVICAIYSIIIIQYHFY